MKTATLPQFLTEAQIAEASRLFDACDQTSTAVDQIQARVIEPNLPAINAKLGQKNDARYLAYAVVHVLLQVGKAHVETNEVRHIVKRCAFVVDNETGEICGSLAPCTRHP